MIKFKFIGYSLIFVLSYMIYSCDDSDKPTIVKGLANDYYSNAPISSYKLWIMRMRYFTIDGGYILVDSLQTDSAGRFQKSIICEHNYFYKLQADYNNKYSSIVDKDIEPGRTNDFSFKVKPYNVLKLDLRNKSHKYNQIFVLSSFWNRWEFNDTVVVIKNSIPEENYNLMIYLYKQKNTSMEDSIVNINIWIEHTDTINFKIEL